MHHFRPPRFVRQPVYTDYDDGYAHDDDIIVGSSPCPPDRSGEQYYIPYTQNTDPIEQYIEDDFYEGQPMSSYSQYAPQYNTQYQQGPFHEPIDTYSNPPSSQHAYTQQIYQQQAFQEEEQEVRPAQQREVLTKAKGIQLRPVSDLPDMYRGLYKFGVFNAVQSSCFDTLVYTNENLVASAPTGSGKTVLFELAMIEMLTRTNSVAQNSIKCVYMAPTKALCSERYRDWTAKFSPLGIKCCELTGDTVQFSKSVWGDAKNSTIIVTTAEKWDSLTRNWTDHGSILSSILLFLVDEVHILNETRGSVLEVVISRMKLRGSSVRFVLVSATAPNIQDIASWIGCQKTGEKARVFEFGEDFRPCKLKRVVVGIPRPRGQNDFQFAKNLDYKLFSTLQTHSSGKPILVFCSTRKGVFSTAEHLVKDYKEAEKKRQALPWTHSARIEHSFNDKRLTELSSYGVGVHHAGMSIDDRRAVEDLFLKRTLRILVATSTLAVGVNLPAHTVVIKGVHTFQNNASVEYSDLDIMQMLGRAGRPQFDNEGMAIILCEGELEDKYRQLAQGQTILESSLHLNLSEHLNSEIGLGTVKSVRSATEWLRSSFLFQRIQKNPRHYALGKEEDETWEGRVDDLVLQSINKLKASELITGEGNDPDAFLKSTEYGDIMSKFYIRQATMAAILALPEKPTVREILEMISGAEELTETKMRASEKTYLNKLKKHNDIRYDVKKVERTCDKVFLLIQAVLGGISLNLPEYKTGDSQPHLDAFGIFRHVPRIARAVVEVGITKKRGAQLKHGFEVMRCLTAKAWEDRPVVLRQIDTIGEKSLKVLAEHGITSLDALRKQDAMRLENLLNRRPPFGLDMLAAVREFPWYTLRVTEIEVRTCDGQGPVEIDLNVECGMMEEIGNKQTKKPKGRSLNMTAIITMTSDMDLIDFRRISTKSLFEKKSFDVTVTLEKQSQAIHVYISSEAYAGLTVTKSYKPDVPSNQYPTRNTRPPSALQAELDELEDDPEFWEDMAALDEFELDIKPSMKDLTQYRPDKSKTKVENAKPVTEHQKLENGNYMCNHPCKDKQKCRHMCCRDGLPKPPKKASANVNTHQVTPLAPINASSTPHVTEPKKKPTPKDHTIKHLETLHKSTNVQENLKLPEGQRLKLPSRSELKRKRKEPHIIDTNFAFADLKDSNAKSTTPPRDLSDGDDDLPAAHEIMNSSSASRPKAISSDDSDPSFDKLLHGLPDDMTFDSRPDSPLRILLESPRPQAKRMKFDDQVQVRNIPRLGSDQERLFLDSDEDNVMDIVEDELESPSVIDARHGGDYAEADDFSLDASCFDIVASTLDLTFEHTHENSRSDDPLTEEKIKETEVIKEVDDFAEFEAWLNSGAVEIVG